MAIVTRSVGGDGDVAIQVDYDDVSLDLVALRCINNGDQAAWVKLINLTDDVFLECVFPASSTDEVAIVPGEFTVTILENGKLDGVEYHIMSPA